MELGVQVLKGLVAISVFLTVVVWDVINSYKKGDKWIQGSGKFTLTALTVLFLGYFDAQNVDPFGKCEGQEFQILLDKQLSVDIGRLVFCVFLGCVLPGVAFYGSGGRWANIAALAVSICMHMLTEVYVLQNIDNPSFRNEEGNMFILSRVLLLVAAICLVLYIGLAVLYCRLTRDRLTLSIPQMLSGSVESKIIDENTGELFKFWAIARGCQQEFWLSSSAFTPAVLVIVTTCIAAVVAKPIYRQSLLPRNNNIVTVSLCLQCVFIFTGWVILVWRWFIFLSLLSPRKKGNGLLNYINYTWVCGIRFCWLIYLYLRKKLNFSLLDVDSRCQFIPAIVWKALRRLAFFIFLTTMLPTGLLFVVICILMLFNILCWLLSSLLVWCVVKVAQVLHCIDMFKALLSDGEESLKTNTGEHLYVAYSSINQAKCEMEEAYNKGNDCKKLLEVIKRSVDEGREVIKNRFAEIGRNKTYDGKGIWKMSAVAAISIMAELAYGWDLNKFVKDVVQAYKEAQDLLEFLDSPSNITVNPLNLFDSGYSRSYQASLEADIKMEQIEKLVEVNNLHPRAVFKDFLTVVSDFKEIEEESSLHHHSKFCRYWSGETGLDTIKYDEGTCLLKRMSMKSVCEAMLRESCSNERELIERAAACLGDIIACGILQLKDVLDEHRRKWAEELKEENLGKALVIQERFKAVKENWKSAESAVTVQADGKDKHNVLENTKEPEHTKVDVQEIETETRNGTSLDLRKALVIQEKFKAIKENWKSAESALTVQANGKDKHNALENTKEPEHTMVEVQETETETRNGTSLDTAPTSGQDKNSLSENTIVDVQETETRKPECIEAEGNPEGELSEIRE